MTTPRRPPTFAEIEEFLWLDGWFSSEGTEHRHWERVFEDGTVLRTVTSRAAGRSPGSGRFSEVLKTQIMVGRDEVWAVLSERRAAVRPASDVEPPPARKPGWVVFALHSRLQLLQREIDRLSADEAEQLVIESYNRPAP